MARRRMDEALVEKRLQEKQDMKAKEMPAEESL